MDEFSAQQVTLDVLSHLERRRASIVGDEGLIKAEIDKALEPVRASYKESELPPAYLVALEGEIHATVPAKWTSLARRYTALEQRDYGLWRGGDVISRITYVFLGLLVGGLCVALPFIPIWEKWFPFLLAGLGWWLPNAQIALQKRRYARALGGIAREVGGAQHQLDRHMTVDDLYLPAPEKTEEKK
jgi:hypothetical protein